MWSALLLVASTALAADERHVAGLEEEKGPKLHAEENAMRVDSVAITYQPQFWFACEN